MKLQEAFEAGCTLIGTEDSDAVREFKRLADTAGFVILPRQEGGYAVIDKAILYPEQKMTMLRTGDFVNAGGCVGTIKTFDDQTVRVDGIYYYSDGEEPGTAYGESWSFFYPREAFKQKSTTKHPFHDGRTEFWDMVGVPHK